MIEKSVEKVITMTEKEFDRAITGSGVEFKFMRMGGKINSIKNMGIKVTYDKTDRDSSYRRQSLAFENRVGPPVGMKVTLIVDELSDTSTSHKVYFGFETGIASVKRKNRLSRRTLRKLNELRIGNDLHSQNIGKWKNKVVAIDFGPISAGTDFSLGFSS